MTLSHKLKLKQSMTSVITHMTLLRCHSSVIEVSCVELKLDECEVS